MVHLEVRKQGTMRGNKCNYCNNHGLWNTLIDWNGLHSRWLLCVQIHEANRELFVKSSNANDSRLNR